MPARTAVTALREYLVKADTSAAEERDREENRKRARAEQERTAERKQSLEKLSARLNQLGLEIGSQSAGYAFQDWYYDVVDYFEVVARRPYVINGRQIDGSVTVDGTTYLNELKFTREQSAAPDVDIFYRKVQDKADNTMGIMVSISGYSATAIDAASGPRTPLLLLDHTHLYLLLSGTISFSELVMRIRRHASQTGAAYLPVGEFGR